MRQFSSNQAGFTLLEVVVASAILVFVSGAVLTVGRAAVRSQDLILERGQAYQLVQEGLELTRQMRDTMWIDEDPTNTWQTPFEEALEGAAVAPVWNETTAQWQLVTDHAGNPEVDGGMQQIILPTNPGVVYFRTLHISEVTSSLPPLSTDQGGGISAAEIDDHMLKVESIVMWDSQGETRSVIGSTFLSNWRLER